jgi:hypothetical protein
MGISMRGYWMREWLSSGYRSILSRHDPSYELLKKLLLIPCNSSEETLVMSLSMELLQVLVRWHYT